MRTADRQSTIRRSAIRSPQSAFVRLPVNPPHQLNLAAGVGAGYPEVVRIISRAGDRIEPGRVERVEELGAELEVHAAFDRHPLYGTQVEAHELRPGHHQVVQPAVP